MMLFASCSNLFAAQNTKALEVKEHKLKNGLTVWLNEDHSQPKVFGAVVVKAGAKDCPDTGIAHYFEHMMFKGATKSELSITMRENFAGFYRTEI